MPGYDDPKVQYEHEKDQAMLQFKAVCERLGIDLADALRMATDEIEAAAKSGEPLDKNSLKVLFDRVAAKLKGNNI